MERIDQEKRQHAGRKVLLDQGITNEEEIAAILSSLDEEEDDQSVDTAAAVRKGRAGNQRAAAAAARQNLPVPRRQAGGFVDRRGRLPLPEVTGWSSSRSW